MPRPIVLLLVMLLCVVGQAQAQPQPGGSASKVNWTVQGDTLLPGQTASVTLRAAIAEGWKMYAPDSPPPTRGVAVTTMPIGASGISIDSLKHTGSEAGHDPNFDITVQYFQDRAQLRLPVAASSTAEHGAHSIEGDLTFMVCTDEICLPPTTESFAAVIQVGRENDS